MSLNVGQLVAELTIDDKKYDRGLDVAERKLEASGQRMRGMASAAGAVVGGLAGAGVIAMMRGAGAAASDLAESTSKAQVVFGDASASVMAFAQNAATGLGQSKQQAIEAAGTFGNLLVALKLPQDEAAKMSTSMVQLGSDLASFNNTSPTEALEALRSGLTGETEPLKRYGINLSDAALRQKALDLGLVKTTTGTLPASIKAQAAYAAILEQSKTAQGDFARTSDGLANKQRIMAARFEDTKAKLGQAFLPVMTEVVGAVGDAAGVVGDLVQALGPLGPQLLAGAGAATAFALGIRGLNQHFGTSIGGGLSGGLKQAAGETASFIKLLPSVTKNAGSVGGAVKNAGSLTKAYAGSMSSAVQSMTGMGPAGLAVAAGVVAVGGAAFLAHKHLEQLKNSHDGVTEAADKLKASIGGEKQTLNEFAAANGNLIGQLQKLSGEQRDAFMFQVGFELVSKGAKPEDAFKQLQRIADAVGIQLPVGLKPADLKNTEMQLTALATQALRLVDEVSAHGGSVGTKTAEEIRGIGIAMGESFKSDEIAGATKQFDAFVTAVRSSKAPIEAQDAAINHLTDEFLKNANLTGVSTDNALDFASAMREVVNSKAGASAASKAYAQALLDDMTAGLSAAEAVQKEAKALADKSAAQDAATRQQDRYVAGLVDSARQADRATSAAAHAQAELRAEFGLTNGQIKEVSTTLGVDLTKNAEGAEHAIERYMDASVNTTPSQETLRDAIKTLNDKLSTAQQRADALRTALHSLGGEQASVTDATFAQHAAVKELAEQTKKHTGTVESNWDALKRVASTTLDMAAAQVTADGNVKGATKSVRDQREALIKTMEKMGASATQANDYADDLGLIPSKVKTILEIDTANATSKLHQLQTLIRQTAQQAQTAYLDFLNERAAAAGTTAPAKKAPKSSSGRASSRTAAATSSADYMSGALPGGPEPRLGAHAAFTPVGDRSMAPMAAAAPTVSTAAAAAYREITRALKEQPTTLDKLQPLYARLRTAFANSADASVAAGKAYAQQKAHVAALNKEVAAADSTKGRTAQLRAELDAVHGNTKAAKARREELRREIADSVHATKVKKEQLAAEEASLKKLETAYTKAKDARSSAGQAAIDTAKTIVETIKQQEDALLDEIDTFTGTLADAISGGALDLKKLWGASTIDLGDVSQFMPGSLDDLKAGLQNQLDVAKQYGDDLDALAKDGASQQLLTYIEGLGTEAGDALTKQLLAGGQDAIAGISDLIQQIGDTGKSKADEIAKTYFGSGVALEQSLIDGMQSMFPELDKILDGQLKSMADRLAAAFDNVTKVPTPTKAGAGKSTTVVNNSRTVVYNAAPGTGSISGEQELLVAHSRAQMLGW